MLGETELMAWKEGQVVNGKTNSYTIKKILVNNRFGIAYFAHSQKGQNFAILTLNDQHPDFAQLQQDFSNKAQKFAEDNNLDIEETFQKENLSCIVMKSLDGTNLEKALSLENLEMLLKDGENISDQEVIDIEPVKVPIPQKNNNLMWILFFISALLILIWMYRCKIFPNICEPPPCPPICPPPPTPTFPPPTPTSPPPPTPTFPPPTPTLTPSAIPTSSPNPPKVSLRPGPAGPETPWIEVPDLTDKTAEFKLVILTDDYRWQIASDDFVSHREDLQETIPLFNLVEVLENKIYKAIDNPNQIISVGAASCEGSKLAEETRAKDRSIQIHNILAKNLFGVKTYQTLNLGQFRADKCNPIPEKNSFQRAIILIGVRKETEGVILKESLKNFLSLKIEDFKLDDFTRFDLELQP